MRTCDMIIEWCKTHPGQEFTAISLCLDFGWEFTDNNRGRISHAIQIAYRYGYLSKQPYTCVQKRHSEYRRYIATPTGEVRN